MPRDHARMQTAIWRGKDWRALNVEAQWAYQALCSQQALSYAGVIDYRPGRLADLAEGHTARRVEASIKALEVSRFVIVDRNTEELLVRTYVRHDGVMDRSNMGKAVGRALAKVVSLDLHAAVVAELTRHYRDKPDLHGWKGLEELYPEVMEEITGIPSPMPSPMASRTGTDGIADASGNSPTPLFPSSLPPVVKASSQSQTEPRGVTSDGLDRIMKLTKGTTAHARKCAEFVLAKAPADVRNPDAYVIAAISEAPDEFRFKRGNPKKGEECPTHAGQWADACAGCAADSKAAS